MRAQGFLVAEEFRFLELAHQARQRQCQCLLPRRIGAGMQVALRRLVHAEGGLVAQVEDQVEAALHGALRPVEVDGCGRAAGAHAVAVRAAARQVDLIAEIDRIFGAGVDAGIAARAQVQVDRVAASRAGFPAGLEGAEPAGKRGQPSTMDRIGAPERLRGSALARRAARQQYRDLELQGREPFGPGQRALRRAQHQHRAVGAVVDHGHRLGFGQRGHRQQRGDLGIGGPRIAPRALRPAAGLADIDEADRRGHHWPPVLALGGLRGDFGKQRALLRAGHDDIVGAIQRGGEGADLAPAQQAMDLERTLLLALAGFRQRRPVKRHGVVAIADQRRHGECG
ncbi:hypothetical protein D3C81_1113490 [compost metagenome]